MPDEVVRSVSPRSETGVDADVLGGTRVRNHAPSRWFLRFTEALKRLVYNSASVPDLFPQLSTRPGERLLASTDGTDLTVYEEAQVKLRLKKEPLRVWGNEMRIRACLLHDKNGEAGQNLAPQPWLHPTVAIDEADSRPHALDPDGEPRRV